MISRLFISTAFLISVQFCFSQNTIDYKTWNPANDAMQVLEGQAWPNEVNDFYDRLPARAEKSVRDISMATFKKQCRPAIAFSNQC